MRVRAGSEHRAGQVGLVARVVGRQATSTASVKRPRRQLSPKGFAGSWSNLGARPMVDEGTPGEPSKGFCQ